MVCTTSRESSRTTTSAGPPGTSRPTWVSPSTRAGTVLAAARAFSSGTPTSTRFRTACEHRQGTAREDAVLAAYDVVRDDDLGLAQRVCSVADPGAGDCIGDEGDPPAGGAPEEADDVRVEMDAVDDRLDNDVPLDERRADHARVPVGERAHRVEDVSDGAHAAVECRVRLARGRVGVPERDRDAARVEQVDQLECAGELGGERHEPHRACREQALEERDIGIPPRGEAVRAEAGGGEEGAFEVGAEDPRAMIPVRDRAQRADHVLLGRRDECRQIRGDAGLEERLSGGGEAVRVGAEEVDAREPVHLEVDEAREPRSRTTRLEPDRRDDAAVELDVARQEPSVDEGSLDPEPHRSSASRTMPPAASSRARAAAASMPATSATIATFASPFASVERGVDPIVGRAGRVRDDPADARAQLVVRRDDVDHEVAVRLPQPDHRDRRDHVEDELLGRPGLEAGRACDDLGPDDDGISWSARSASSDPAADTTATVVAPAARAAASAPHVRGASARAEADDGVVLPDRERLDPGGSSVAVVLAASCSIGALSPGPPATSATTRPGGTPNVASHSDASTAARRPDVPAPT